MAGINRTHALARSTIQKTDYYSVGGGKMAPSAKALQKMANAQHISSEVTRVEWKNETSIRTALCTAYVRAWVGSRARPKQEQTDALTMSMTAIAQKFIIKKLNAKSYAWNENDVEINELTGMLQPVGKRKQMELMSFMADQFAFLDRLAITKCQARVFDKMLRPNAESHYGDDDNDEEQGYAPPHETAPEPPGSGTDTDTTLPGETTGRDTAPDAGPPHEDPPAPETRHAGGEMIDAAMVAEVLGEERDVAFLPSEQEVDAHTERVEKQATETTKKVEKVAEEVKLSERAQSVVKRIEELKGSKKNLDTLADSLKAMKTELPPEESGRVMQVFWHHYREAK